MQNNLIKHNTTLEFSEIKTKTSSPEQQKILCLIPSMAKITSFKIRHTPTTNISSTRISWPWMNAVKMGIIPSILNAMPYTAIR